MQALNIKVIMVKFFYLLLQAIKDEVLEKLPPKKAEYLWKNYPSKDGILLPITLEQITKAFNIIFAENYLYPGRPSLQIIRDPKMIGERFWKISRRLNASSDKSEQESSISDHEYERIKNNPEGVEAHIFFLQAEAWGICPWSLFFAENPESNAKFNDSFAENFLQKILQNNHFIKSLSFHLTKTEREILEEKWKVKIPSELDLSVIQDNGTFFPEPSWEEVNTTFNTFVSQFLITLEKEKKESRKPKISFDEENIKYWQYGNIKNEKVKFIVWNVLAEVLAKHNLCISSVLEPELLNTQRGSRLDAQGVMERLDALIEMQDPITKSKFSPIVGYKRSGYHNIKYKPENIQVLRIILLLRYRKRRISEFETGQFQSEPEGHYCDPYYSWLRCIHDPALMKRFVKSLLLPTSSIQRAKTSGSKQQKVSQSKPSTHQNRNKPEENTLSKPEAVLLFAKHYTPDMGILMQLIQQDPGSIPNLVKIATQSTLLKPGKALKLIELIEWLESHGVNVEEAREMLSAIYIR